MTWDSLWPILIPLAAALVSALRDPRTVRTGVFLLTALVAALLLAFGSALQSASALVPDTPVDAWILLGAIGVVALAVITLAVFLVLTGVQVLRREGRSPAHALALALGVAMLVYLAAGVLAVARGWEQPLIWLALIALPVGWCGYGLLAYLLWSWLYTHLSARLGRRVAAVVVLGAGLVGGSHVGPLLRARLDRGIAWTTRPRQLRGGAGPALLVCSGGQGPDEDLPEAVAMGAYARERGVPADRVLQEDASTTTQENVRFSARLLAERDVTGPVAVVTSNYHAFRAATLMRAEKVSGYAVGAPTAQYYWPTAVLREYVAIMRDHLRLNVVGLALSSLPLVAWIAVLIGG